MLEIKPVNGEANDQRKNWTKPLILPKMQKVKRRLCTSKTKKMKIYIYIYIKLVGTRPRPFQKKLARHIQKNPKNIILYSCHISRETVSVIPFYFF